MNHVLVCPIYLRVFGLLCRTHPSRCVCIEVHSNGWTAVRHPRVWHPGSHTVSRHLQSEAPEHSCAENKETLLSSSLQPTSHHLSTLNTKNLRHSKHKALSKGCLGRDANGEPSELRIHGSFIRNEQAWKSGQQRFRQ